MNWTRTTIVGGEYFSYHPATLEVKSYYLRLSKDQHVRLLILQEQKNIPISGNSCQSQLNVDFPAVSLRNLWGATNYYK